MGTHRAIVMKSMPGITQPSCLFAEKFHRRPVRRVRGNLASFRVAALFFRRRRARLTSQRPMAFAQSNGPDLAQVGVGGGSNSQVHLSYRRPLLATVPWVNSPGDYLRALQVSKDRLKPPGRNQLSAPGVSRAHWTDARKPCQSTRPHPDAPPSAQSS